MLKDLSSSQLASLLQAVETRLVNRLNTCGCLYKSEVVKAISDAGECSPASVGIEKSFLKVIKSRPELQLTPKFAELMGEPVPFQDPKQDQAPSQRASQASLLNLKGVSMLEWTPGGTRISFIDGSVGQAGRVDASTLRSSCNLIEFRSSSGSTVG